MKTMSKASVPVILLAWLISGCIPATTPAQLEYTPGPPVIITDDRYETQLFSVERPDGWRVIASAADAPPSVIFVAPDDRALILVSTSGIGEPPRPNIEDDVLLQDMVETAELDDLTISVYGVGPETEWNTIQTHIQQVLASLQLPQNP